MAQFDESKVVWSRDGKDIPEGTFVLTSDSIEDLKLLVEKECWVKASVVVHKENPTFGKTTSIDLYGYLGGELKRHFVYPIDKALDKDINRYIKRAIFGISQDIKIVKECKETYEKEGLVGYVEKAVAEKSHIIEVLEKALAA